MAIRADLRTYCLAQSSITTLIGTRLSLSRRPINTDGTAGESGGPYPCVTYSRANGGHFQNMDASDGYCEAMFEFDFWSNVATDIESVSEAFRLKLQGYRGAMGSSSIKLVKLEDEIDFYHPAPDGSDKGIYRTTQRYLIGFVAPIPTY